MQKLDINKVDQAVINYKFYENSDEFKKVFSLINANSKLLKGTWIITGVIAIFCWMIIFFSVCISLVQSIILHTETLWNTYPTLASYILLAAALFSVASYFAYSYIESGILETRNIYLPNVTDNDILSLDDTNIDKYFSNEISIDKLKQYKEIANISQSFSILLLQIMNDRKGKILWIDYILLGGINFINAGEIEKDKAIKIKEADKIKTEIKGLAK
ncbi:MAG: hypothetical protein AB7V48_16170 [Sedimentibacter sp.]